MCIYENVLDIPKKINNIHIICQYDSFLNAMNMNNLFRFLENLYVLLTEEVCRYISLNGFIGTIIASLAP